MHTRNGQQQRLGMSVNITFPKICLCSSSSEHITIFTTSLQKMPPPLLYSTHSCVGIHTPNRRTPKDSYPAKRNTAGMLTKVAKHNKSSEGVINDPWFIHPVSPCTIIRVDGSTDRRKLSVRTAVAAANNLRDSELTLPATTSPTRLASCL